MEIKDFSEIQRVLGAVSAQTLVLLDVDDTLITPQSNMFRVGSPARHLIDDLKKDRENIPELEKILSIWRSQRQAMLVHRQWPELLTFVREQGALVYALTHINTGQQDLHRVEEWRYRELRSLNIRFSPFFCGYRDNIVLPFGNPAVFYKGCFLTGSHSKGDVLRVILSEYRPKDVIFIDDRLSMVQEIGGVCEEQGLPYQGYIYRGIEQIPGEVSLELMALQKRYLLEHYRWLEDKEALLLLNPECEHQCEENAAEGSQKNTHFDKILDMGIVKC
jgi:hypothetical protein